MTEASAGGLCRTLDQGGIRAWIVGGWGVDALLGRCTRQHKDLDVLLGRSQHEQAWQILHGRGYRLAYRWEENVDVPGTVVDGTVRPTAYVLEDQSGRQVDVHVLDDQPPALTPLWSTDRTLIPGALDARGTIDGVHVRCMSARMQLLAHEGTSCRVSNWPTWPRLNSCSATTTAQVSGRRRSGCASHGESGKSCASGEL